MIRLFFILNTLIFAQISAAKNIDQYTNYQSSLLNIIQKCSDSLKIFTDEINDSTISNALIISSSIKKLDVQLHLDNSLATKSHINEFNNAGIKLYNWPNFKPSLHLLFCDQKAYKFDRSLVTHSFSKQNFDISRLNRRHLRLLQKYLANSKDLLLSKSTPSHDSISPAFQTNTNQTTKPAGFPSTLPSKPKYLQLNE